MRAASILGRILIFFLIFILGFLSCIGVFVGGGYLAYTRLSLDKLGVNTSGILSDDAEVDISALPIGELVAEFSALKSAKISVALLVERYGLILPSELDSLLTDELREMEFTKLFSQQGIKELLSELYFGKLFGYERKDNPNYSILDPDAEPEMIWVNPDTGTRVIGINGVLADITVGEFLDGGIPTQKIMDDLSVGELMELTAKTELPVFIKSEDGSLVLVEDIDPITVWYDSDGNEVASVVGAIADKSVSELTTGLDDISLGKILGTVAYKDKNYTYEVRRTLDEHIVLTEAESIISEFADLSIDGLTGDQVNDKVNNVEISSLLGYKKDEATGDWLDSNGKKVNPIMAQLASSKVGGLNETIDTLSFGDIAELVAVDENGDVIEDLDAYEGEITWYEKGYEKGSPDNVLAAGLMASLAGLSVGDMNDSSAITDAIKDTAVGDAMGYVKKDGVWYTDDTYSTEASGIMSSLADSKVGEMNEEVDKITFAKVAELVAVDENGEVIEDVDSYEGEITWYEKGYEKGALDNELATSVMIALAMLSIGDMSDNDALTDAVGEVVVGEALGYERSVDENGKEIWLTKETDPITGDRQPAKGIMAVIADYKVTELNSKVDEITLGEVSGLEAREEPDPADPSKTVTVWYDENGEVASGVTGALANMTVADMSDDAALTEQIKKVTVGDAMGYKAVEEDGKIVWYERYDGVGDPDNKTVSGIMKRVASFKVGDMNTEVNKITLADISEMEKVYYLKADDTKVNAEDIGNYSENDLYFVWENSDGTKASGLMAGLAHLTVEDFGDEKKVSDAVKDLRVGDAMGYENVDGVWYTEYDSAHPEKNRLTGLTKAIADDLVRNMDESAKRVTIADVAELIAVDENGYIIEVTDVEAYNGVWYEEYHGKDDPRNKPTSGLMAGLAHMTLADMQDPDVVKDTVGTLKAGHAMGYENVDGVWYEKYEGVDDPDNKELTGLVKAIADSPVEDLNADIQSMKFGTVAGLTYDATAGKWMDGAVEATGINAALADLTVGEMSDSEALSESIQKVTVADAMGYVADGDGFRDKNGDPVEGFMSVIANKKISEIQGTLDTTAIGEFMGYEKDEFGVWKKDGTKADGLMQKVCSKNINELDGLLNELELRDVIETRSGLLSIVPEDTKVVDLDDTIKDMFTDENGRSVTMGQLEDANLIVVEGGLSATMRSWTFKTFVSKANDALKLAGH